MHRLVLFLALGFVEQTASAEPVKVLQNARALRDFLVAGRQAATIEPVVAERGCGPINCSIDLDGVSILRNRGVVLDAATRKPLKIRQQTAGKLPTLDWQPLRGFSVSHVGRRWGTCLEFTHAGLGKSGRLQYTV